jgi:hypothetical protein
MNIIYNVYDSDLLAPLSVRLLFYGRSTLLTIFSPFKIPLSAVRPNVLLVLVLTLCLILPFVFRRNLKDKDGHPIPPGPLFRHAAIRPYPERTLRNLSKTYGPWFSLWLGDQLFVVISDARIAKDLLVSNSAIFSSRGSYFMKSQTIYHGLAITATPYNDK